MEIEILINRYYSQFSEIDKNICQYILEHKIEISKMSITELAAKSYTSKSSVLRFVQKLGFSGYSEFKYLTVWEKKEPAWDLNQMIDIISVRLHEVFSHIRGEVLNTFFEMILQSNKIYLVSTGMNQQYQALDLQRNFLKYGIGMNYLPSAANSDLSIAVSDNLSAGDLILVFSFSGENNSVKEMLTIPLLKNVKIISITGTEKNWLNNQSHLHISLSAETYDQTNNLFSSGLFHMLIDYISLEFAEYRKNKLYGKDTIK